MKKITKKFKKRKKINLSKKQDSNELVFKTRNEWVRQSTVDKKNL